MSIVMHSYYSIVIVCILGVQCCTSRLLHLYCPGNAGLIYNITMVMMIGPSEEIISSLMVSHSFTAALDADRRCLFSASFKNGLSQNSYILFWTNWLTGWANLEGSFHWWPVAMNVCTPPHSHSRRTAVPIRF